MNWNAKERSEVALNRIWSEHVDKEMSKMLPKTKYTCNPCSSIDMNNGLGSRVPFVTDKVGTTGSENVELGDDPDVLDVVNGLLRAHMPPKEKYEDPVTSAHEVGWYSQPLVAPNPRFQYGLKQAEGTRFAETYTKKMSGEHMFHGKSGKYLKF
mmetsp:Transcript_3003/g.7477  ORF Transcript_3003/g.7477 Transcript_3003/m.7477 type:complete len:154 (+) Transcript_3003:24-485(+)